MQTLWVPDTCRNVFLENAKKVNDCPLVLVVDDDATMRLLIRAALEKAHFRVIEAEDGATALQMFHYFRPDIVLQDLLMPEMDGFAALRELRRSPGGECIPILVITGLDDVKSINKAYELGATDFITKPINWTIFGYRVRNHVRAGRTLVELQESERHLAHAQRIAHLGHWQWHKEKNELIWSSELQRIFGINPTREKVTYQTFITASHPNDKELIAQTIEAALTEAKSFEIDYRIVLPDSSQRIVHLQGQVFLDEAGKPAQVMGTVQDITKRKQAESLIKESMTQLQNTLEGAVCALSSAVEIRDPYTAGHQKLVAQLSGAIAREMGLPGCQKKGIKVAGALHDIGKICIPAEILCKPSHLTEIEFSLIKNHSQIGYDVLKEIEFPWPVALAVHQHHERWDGSGYPQGLKGTDILQEARILAVADVVESMVHHRPYRAAHHLDVALAEIREKRGIKYDPDVVDACLKIIQKGFEFM